MILKFNISGSSFFIGVGSVEGRKTLSVAAPYSKFIFLTISDLKKIRVFSSKEIEALKETDDIINSLGGDESIKDYVVVEMKKLGAVFDRVYSVKEYEVFLNNNV